VTASPKDDSLSRLLETLPRHDVPAIPVEKLFRRLAWRRVRFATICLAAIGTPLLARLVFHEEPKPPVNLHLRIVELGDPIEMPTQVPAELNLP